VNGGVGVLAHMRYSRAISFVAIALVLVGCHHSSPPSASATRHVVTDAERAAWPKTVDEAATRILADMKDADKKQVRETKKDN
jgi:hypothetical protein